MAIDETWREYTYDMGRFNGLLTSDLKTKSKTRPKREITITELDSGFNVKVGCKTFAVETQVKLIAKLNEYLTDPIKTEEKFNKTNKI